MFHNFERKSDGHNPQNNYPPSQNRALALASQSTTWFTQLGKEKEAQGLDRYCELQQTTLAMRNEETLTVPVRFTNVILTISGRPDGVCRKNGVVVEHKYRTRGLLGYCPVHERVQCHLYMSMLGLNTAHLVETFGRKIAIHVIAFDHELWKTVSMRVMWQINKSDFAWKEKSRAPWKIVSHHESNMVHCASPHLEEPTCS